jgi:hypothetical protein
MVVSTMLTACDPTGFANRLPNPVQVCRLAYRDQSLPPCLAAVFGFVRFSQVVRKKVWGRIFWDAPQKFLFIDYLHLA